VPSSQRWSVTSRAGDRTAQSHNAHRGKLTCRWFPPLPVVRQLAGVGSLQSCGFGVRQVTRTPRVSIGLPVRNGGNYLRDALDSLLSQTLADFELIIGDNASTDDTDEICREFAARDDRIRYVRHTTDTGGPRNFNFVFQEARAPYFRWAAHDDLAAPENLAQCVATLDADPTAVLAAPDTTYIDGSGVVLRHWHAAPGLEATRPGPRFAPAAVAVPAGYGLIRSEALARTRLYQVFAGADRVLLVELCLRGRFRRVPEPLITLRDHTASFSRAVFNAPQEARWLDPQGTPPIGHSRMRVLRACARAIRDAPLGARDRAECWARLGYLTVAWHRYLLKEAWTSISAMSRARTHRTL
jgi:glycosyltransferase involved in cell wall biosynthesis